MKRFFFLLSIIAIIILVILIGSFFRYRNQAAPEGIVGPGGTLPPGFSLFGLGGKKSGLGPLPGAGGGLLGGRQTLGLVAQNKVLDYFVYPDQNVIVVQPDGQIVKLTASESTALNALPIANLLRATFSADGQKILLVFGNSKNPQFSLFDTTTKVVRVLDLKPLGYPRWLERGQSLAYLSEAAPGSGEKILTVLTIQSSTIKTKPLTSLKAEDLELVSADDNEVLLASRPSALARSALLVFNLKKKTLQPILDEKRGLDVLWNSEAGFGAVFVADRYLHGGQLMFVNRTGGIQQNLVLLTLPSIKCAWRTVNISPAVPTTSSSTAAKKTIQPPPPVRRTMICALPQDRQSFGQAVLPDAYLQNELMTQDSLIEIDIVTGSIHALTVGVPEVFDAGRLKIFGSTLYFVNRLNQKLYSVSISE